MPTSNNSAIRLKKLLAVMFFAGFILAGSVSIIFCAILIYKGYGNIGFGNLNVHFSDIKIPLIITFVFILLTAISRIFWGFPSLYKIFNLYHYLSHKLDNKLRQSLKIKICFFGCMGIIAFIMMMALTWDIPFHHDDWGMLGYSQEPYSYKTIVRVIDTGPAKVFRPAERLIFMTVYKTAGFLGFDILNVFPYRVFKAAVFSGAMLVSALILFLLLGDWRVVFISYALLLTSRPMLRSTIWLADFTIVADLFILFSIYIFFLYDRRYQCLPSKKYTWLFMAGFIIMSIWSSLLKETARILPFIFMFYFLLTEKRKIKQYLFPMSLITLFNLNPPFWLGQGWVRYDKIVRFKIDGLKETIETIGDKFGMHLFILVVIMAGLLLIRRYRRNHRQEIDDSYAFYISCCLCLTLLYSLMPYLCERHFSTLMVFFTPLAAMSLLEIDKIHKRKIKRKQVNRMISFFIVFSIIGIAVFGFNSDLKYRVKKGNPLKLREIIRQHFENNMQDAIIIYNDWNIDFQYFWLFKNKYIDYYWDNGILEEIKTTDKPVFFVLYPWSTVFDGVEKKELYKVFSLGEEEYKVYRYVP